MGVGGSFDIFAGRNKRAPKFFRKLGLEWLYRFASQPYRIWRFLNIFRFLLIIFREKLFPKKTPTKT